MKQFSQIQWASSKTFLLIFPEVVSDLTAPFIRKNRWTASALPNEIPRIVVRLISLFFDISNDGKRQQKIIFRVSASSGGISDLLNTLRGHPYTTWSDEGVHEMTMNNHEGEGEGFRNDHVVRWIDIFLFSIRKRLNSPFEQHSLHAQVLEYIYLHINMTKK